MPDSWTRLLYHRHYPPRRRRAGAAPSMVPIACLPPWNRRENHLRLLQ
ncbi:hypothetical protein L493_1821 [Bordetella bronchiseptica 99-R-0433]|nr:hypothetical protein L493_1821 [Bordetella bronchiseptica 99-R-0433]